jgi:CitB family two-component system response regulator MalR
MAYAKKKQQDRGEQLKALNILLVDDDEMCVFIHSKVLELSGCCNKTKSACNGQRALEYLRDAASGSHPVPDIIFLDLQMPLMNGLDFLEAYQSLPFARKEQIAIVLLSSSVSEKDKEYAMSRGVRHYLTKPFTLDAFYSVIRSLYGIQEGWRAMFPHK